LATDLAPWVGGVAMDFTVKNFKSPLNPPFPKGDFNTPPFEKGGQGGFFILGGENLFVHKRLAGAKLVPHK
jgi:hypothetical protein